MSAQALEQVRRELQAVRWRMEGITRELRAIREAMDLMPPAGAQDTNSRTYPLDSLLKPPHILR